MALSTIHDVSNHGPHQAHNAAAIKHVPTHVIYSEKHFRPNPEAKPFVPNPFAVPPPNWHYIPSENSKNGFLPPYWVQPSVNHELPANASSKKHIAFHLVSNVLDDEVPEDVNKELIQQHMNYQPAHISMIPPLKNYNTHNNTLTNVMDTWHESNSHHFNLPLHAEPKSEKSSINNKSIHEIWSPDPSPSNINSLSQNDTETTAGMYNQKHVLDSSSSVINNPNISFEQVQSAMISQQMYDAELENVDDNQQSPYYYQPQSPIYQRAPYDYRNLPSQHVPQAHPPPTEMYTVLSPRNMGNNIRPVVLEPSRGFYSNPHCVNRYQSVEDHQSKSRRSTNHHRDQHPEPPVQKTYETRMTCVEELGICIDECCDQLKHLERDCKKADATLSQEFRLRKPSLGESCTGKYSPNSTRIDKLIIDLQKEHQKVESLIGRIERVGFTPMHSNVGMTLDLWLTAIKELRNARKNELASVNENVPYGNTSGKSHSQADVHNLVSSVKELTKLTRSARTIVWCATQTLYGNNSDE